MPSITIRYDEDSGDIIITVMPVCNPVKAPETFAEVKAVKELYTKIKSEYQAKGLQIIKDFLLCAEAPCARIGALRIIEDGLFETVLDYLDERCGQVLSEMSARARDVLDAVLGALASADVDVPDEVKDAFCEFAKDIISEYKKKTDLKDERKEYREVCKG